MSAVAFVTALSAMPAQAQTISALRGAAGIAQAAVAAAHPAAPSGPTNYPGMSSAQVRALQYQARAAAGVDLATQAQQAARASALALSSSVPNGLGVGGLDPVDNPLKAADDPNGLSTWDGADAPTETRNADGTVDVTIEQTQQRAVLSWDTFNVGQKTTLTFDQKQGGVSQPDWVVLNRVVGQLDPSTGLRRPDLAPAPSQILGSIKADGTVLILNQNGVLFGGASQVNVHSLVATSLEVGRAFDATAGKALTIKDRDDEFLNFGLLAYADQASINDKAQAFTFSAQQIDGATLDPMLEGTIQVDAGAEIKTADSGFILLTGPKVTNAGHLTSPDGEVALTSGRQITLTRSEGRSDSSDPNVRGFLVTTRTLSDLVGDYVLNTGLIDVPRGYISLGSTTNGAVIQDGVLHSTTSVSRNGFVRIEGGDIKIAKDSTISIEPDDGKETIPQDPTSLDAFKVSRVEIGDQGSNVEIGSNAMIYAPGADILIGSEPGETTQTTGASKSRVFVDTGAVIDAAGLTDVLIPASRNAILIRPVKKNELRDTPDYKDGFLNGVEVYVDPRLSGVRADGVAWIGSPLIEAESYYQQVGVSAAELMTRGGNVTLGVSAHAEGATGPVPTVIVKSGAVIDISGGWVKYEAGMAQTTRLINANGQVVDIADADPNDTYIGVYGGFTDVHSRWGVTETWANPLMAGTHYEGSYTEGRDAGTLTIKASAGALDGTVYANSFPGARQLHDAQIGSGTGAVYGDLRHVQGAASQMPVGGLLFLQALAKDASSATTVDGGGDIQIVDESDYEALNDGQRYGQSVHVDAEGNLVVPPPDDKTLPKDRLGTFFLSDQALSNMGLGQLSLHTSGQVTDQAGTELNLSPGAVFDVLAGRTITIDGSVTAASGDIRLQTVYTGAGSVFKDDPTTVGSFDIVVNGTLSTRGQWVNDFGKTADQIQGSAYTDGGSISIISAARIAEIQEPVGVDDTLNGVAPTVNTDLSGSILINKGAVIDVSGGGRVEADGTLDLSAKGGDLSLLNDTTYFQIASDPTQAIGLSGFRVLGVLNNAGEQVVVVNPDKINAHVAIDGTILAHGFAGGGTFTLDTPELSLGGDGPGTSLALDFFSKTGFGNYNITSYKTALLQNQFKNGLGGFNAVMQFQTLTIGAGQTLDLTQTTFSQILDDGQQAALRNLGTGGDLYSVMKPTVAADAWDRRAVNLELGGALELHVDKGGSIIGEAGGQLTVSKLFNEGLIRIAGGTIRQEEVLPGVYASDAHGVQSLSDAFTFKDGGGIRPDQTSALDPGLTNSQLAAGTHIYLTGDLGEFEGVKLADGSVTDLSGEALINPRATAVVNGFVVPVRDGRMIDGGALITMPGLHETGSLFADTHGFAPTTLVVNGTRLGQMLDANQGSVIDISGASDTFAQRVAGGYAPTQVWSDGGSLMLGSGGALIGADIHAQGGAEQALGGTLVMLDPRLSQHGDNHALNAVSADLIEEAGFSTFEAMGSLTAQGDVNLKLDRAFFLVSRPVVDVATLGEQAGRDALAPVVSSTGVLEIDAPYIRFDSAVQSISTPFVGDKHKNTAIFRADTIDVSGAVVFDQTIADAQLIATNDLRLTGVQPYQHVFQTGDQTVANSLQGMLAVNGDLEITAGQVYPTTGSTFTITSSAADGRITFARSGSETPDAPYSAGGDLTVQAANIVQGGVIRAPLGKLTLGSGEALVRTGSLGPVAFAPVTRTLELTDDSLTSVSAEGLSIPYGTTTDQIEWFFSPTSSAKLTAPPTGELHIGGDRVALDSGANVDLSGGGDVFAYEFISGTGGSRDVLDRFNNDPFSSHTGFQYPDGRQVYAIVPGLSDATVAPFDPIYSSDYSNLYSASAAGQRVYLSGAPGVPAGWYTLLPAKYAVLPGGMRVVEQVGSPAAPLGSNGRLNDGSLLVTGYYGVAGTDSRESTVRTFEVQDQATFRKYSTIALTFGNQTFADLAAKNDEAAPRLPIDAGRLVLTPTKSLTIDASFDTTPAQGGRGAEADIAGDAFQIVSSITDGDLPKGAIVLTADSLSNLNASSLLIGGVRTDNADGTTSLDITAHSITVANDADHPLTGPEVVLAVDGQGSGIDVLDGSVITASGGLADPRAGDYLIDGSASDMTGIGAVLRVSIGPERLVERLNADAVTDPAHLSVGASSLDGDSVLLSSSGDLTASDEANIRAKRLALGAGKVSFTDDGTGLSGLVVTPTLQALFAKADHLTIQTPQAIDFKGGTYTFGDLTLDTAGFGSIDGGAVTLNAGDLTLANSSSDLGACDGETTAACGAGALTIKATEIAFGSGQLRTYGFGASVTLTASDGVFAQGKGGLDAGPAALSIQAPFIGDRAVALLPGEEAILPSLALTTSGVLTVSNPGGAAPGDIEGTPGASISLTGDAVTISGSTVRATAGKLEVTSNQGLVVGDGAVLETPGYAKTFGDSADPYTVSAPGGLLHLTSLTGDIDLQAGSTLSVGGEKGRAGTLAFTATQGEVAFGGTLDTTAPDAGGSFVLDIGGGFDLDAFESGLASNFTGSIDIHTRAGDLTLSDGRDLKAENVYLTADGGKVDIGGVIDVSGVSGGEVSLFGISGVTLESTAFIDAHADGYADTDTRQAKGGVVLIGTDGDGAVNVLDGARIDVSAKRTGDRLVPMERNGTTYYTYVPGDVGGVVGFRLPIIGDTTSATVNLTYAGQIDGASSIVLEAFKRFDLGQIASDPNFVGVTINDQGQAVLDVGATSDTGQFNWLADNQPGTLVDFVQTFAVADSMKGQLGDLADSGVFHERPGMELDYAGDIVLNSNWNLGAGEIKVQDAVDAGLMAPLNPGDPNTKYYILPGKEQEVFNRFGSLTYRTNHGAIDGEPGVLTMRAGGNLDIKGSITDGFFQFHDQNDPDYLTLAMGGGNPVYLPTLSTGCNADCALVGDWQPGDPSTFKSVTITFPGATSLKGPVFNPAPYNAAANTPSAPGSLDGGAGDPLASAELFPLLIDLNTHAVTGHVNSWDYRLVAGADLIGGAGAPSADPMAVLAGSTGSVIVEGGSAYQFAVTSATGTSSFDDTLYLRVGGRSVTADQWLASFLAANPDLDENSYTYIDFTFAPDDVKSLLTSKAGEFFSGHGDQSQLIVDEAGNPTGVTTTLALAAQFMNEAVEPSSEDIISHYQPPRPVVDRNPINGFTTTLIRTGTGDISLAAAQNIDLTNGAATYRNTDGQLVVDPASGLQVGGASIYTAGYRADLTPRTVTDGLAQFTIDPSLYEQTADVFATPLSGGYRYGADNNPSLAGSGYMNTFLANPVYAEGGGDIDLTAGGDVLGRQNVWQANYIARFYSNASQLGYTWLGSGDQPWRVGAIGDVTNIRINPQLFSDGIGALAGGDVKVTAGGDVIDLSVVADTTITTADVRGTGKALTQALWTLGGGNLTVRADGDILGGRFDIASGRGMISSGGDITNDGSIQVIGSLGFFSTPNGVRLRLSDATVWMEARGDIALNGIVSLGVRGSPSSSPEGALNSLAFYSTNAGVNLLSDGSVNVANRPLQFDANDNDVLTVGDRSSGLIKTAVYPGSFEAVALTGDLDITAGSDATASAKSVVLTPSPTGELRLLAGADIAPLTIAMLDADPGLLPGVFSDFSATSTQGVVAGQTLEFPGVLPGTSDTDRRAQHNSSPTHEGDEEPNRIVAGNDIEDMVISTPKQTRILAGRDIINMMFFGQNLSSDDITRIVAGRDITATTHLVRPIIGLPDQLGAPLPALDGNTFVIGGPGAFFLEAGRDAGPFLNSAVTNGFAFDQSSNRIPTGPQSYAGGIISVGNEWNPWLEEKGADLYVMFGVGKGANYDGLRDYYLDPANLANLDGDLFVQTKDQFGNSVPDRTQPIYGPILIQWMQAHAAAQLQAAYGRTDVSFQEAYDVFKALPPLRQRIFLLDNVYFNELVQTSLPDGPSYQQYSRGYLAVNTLFPASLGYTQNDLSGGSNGANELVHTGDLDLRLAAIETSRGGNIYVLGPGGRVLAGSTVRTSEQAARRAYDGGRLFTGNAFESPLPAAITSIPIGFEGVLTLRGGSIFTFTDQDFLLNQSRLFTEAGGDIAMWSSNGDLNAGQGPKTSASFPPVAVKLDEDAFSTLDTASAVSGAGIAAFQPAPGVEAPDVFLIAPRGTVDAGDAGVRVAGNLFIAALQVANANNFSVGGTATGIPTGGTVDVGAQTNAGATTAAAAQAAEAATGGAKANEDQESVISANVVGYAGSDEDPCKRQDGKRPAGCPAN